MKTPLLLLLLLVTPLLSPTFARVQTEACPEVPCVSGKDTTSRETGPKLIGPNGKKSSPTPKTFRLPPAAIRM